MISGRLRKRQGRRLRPVRPSRQNELWYKAELLAIVAQLRRAARESILPFLQTTEPLYAKAGDSVPSVLRVSDRASVTIAPQIEALKRRFGGISGVAQRLAEAAANRNLSAVDARLRASVQASLGVDIGGFLSRGGPIQDVVKAATKANVALIKSIPEQYFYKVEAAVTEGLGQGLRFSALAKQIEDIGDVTESRAKLIARDQTSKLNGAMTQIRQMSIGIDRYTWSTSSDERVRDEHAALDGQEFSWSSPPSEGHPGEAVNCRCVAVPVINLDEGEGQTSAFSFQEAAGTVAAAVSIGAFFASLAEAS